MTRIAFASYRKIAGRRSVAEQPIWKSIHDAQPDLLLLLGDNVHVKQVGPRRQLDHLNQMYAQPLAKPHFAALIAAVPCMAIWDDHDFGPNDSRGDTDQDRPFRDKSRRLFHMAWKTAVNGNRPRVC